MDSVKSYSVEEVMNFTVKDVEELNHLEVKGWPNLTPDERDKCIVRLRDLVRQRDEVAQSAALDLPTLDAKLRQISSRPTSKPSSLVSRSSTPSIDHESILKENLRDERIAYNTLIDDGGIPSYPIDLMLDVFDNNPGEYQDIVTYWNTQGVDETAIFRMQSKVWTKFRDYQQRMRRYYLERNKFDEYQQKICDRRRRHGLEGDVELSRDRNHQSKLANWMEYQDYEYQGIETFEKKIEGAHREVESAQKALEEAGLPGFPGSFDPNNFSDRCAMCTESNQEESMAVGRRVTAERELALAQKRLKVAQSDQLGEEVERAAWIRLFLEDVQSSQIRLDGVPNSGYRFDEWHQEGKRDPPPPEEKEGWKLWWEFEDKRREAVGKRWDAYMKATQEVEFAEAGLNAAQSDSYGETIDRADLIRLLQKELEPLQPRLDEARKSEGEARIRGNLLAKLGAEVYAKTQLKRHKALVEWIEQQRRKIACEPTTSDKHIENCDSQDQTTRPRSRTFREHTAAKVPATDRPSKRTGGKRGQPKARSMLSPVDPSRVSKASGKKRNPPRRKRSTSYDMSLSAEKEAILGSNPQRSSLRISKLKDNISARGPEGTSLRPVHSSRVSKARKASGRAQPTKIKSSAPSASRRPAKSPTPDKPPPRRSTRISKKPDRFCPGKT
ncbi:MAG: hypothetical protein M1837_005122 [Sclerophora amabilis]|nr:MAG: hypothetical protein M1837_005122 [Sclerophora amabilis]